MRHILVLCILCTILTNAVGQSFVTNMLSNGTRARKIDTLSSGNIVVGNAFESGVSLFDPQGQLLHSVCHPIESQYGMVRLQSNIKLSDTLFGFCSGTYEGSCDVESFYKNPAFGTMDTLGNILSSYYFTLNGSTCNFTADDLIRCANGDVILWSYSGGNFALRCSSNGELRWAKSYDQVGGISFVRELPGGDLLLGFNLQQLYGVVARVTENGAVLWSKSYSTSQGMVCDALIHNDDSFTIIGYTDSLLISWQPRPSEYQPELYLLRLNGAGEVQWGRSYDTAPNYWYTRWSPRVVGTPDGNLAVLATLGPATDFIREHRPYLMKLDLNGDTLWTRSYGEPDKIFQSAELTACADGSFLYTMNDEYLNYLVRTDPQGYLPCNNEHYGLTINELFLTDTNVVLTASEGAQVFTTQLSPMPCEDMEVRNACGDPLAVPEWLLPPHLRIRPNPTPGRITVEFTEPVQRHSFYSVLDATGRLLYQRPLPAGGTEEDIDLSRFGPGTYILRITDPDGQRNERVVVE
jgi:hypothetical protein